MTKKTDRSSRIESIAKRKIKETVISEGRLKELRKKQRLKADATNVSEDDSDQGLTHVQAGVLKGCYLFPNNRGPSTRTGTALVKYKNSVYIFGGLATKCFNDLWQYDFSVKLNSNQQLDSSRA